MIHKLLEDFSKELCGFLAEVLPDVNADWWKNCVIDRLTFQQQSFTKNAKPEDLSGLDLASLMRILDQNWYEISSRKNLLPISRTWLRELQTIRNRWAHAPAGGLVPEETYRDLDTLGRFLQTINANSELIRKINFEKNILIGKLSENNILAKGISNEIESAPANSKFLPGSIIRLKARNSITGAVIGYAPGVPEGRYTIFHDGSTASYYESQLESAPTPGVESVVVNAQEFNGILTASQLLHPGIENLYSLYSARINFVPYQFRPVLKLIQADRPRLLIADEVGVGKTIEAGLILKELQARRELRSVLVICPKPLVAERKWVEELKRFDEQFIQLDGDALRHCIEETHLNGVWPQQFSRAIVPYSLFDEALLYGRQRNGRKQRGLLDLDPPPVFDLVIADEAHHIRNTETWAYRAAGFFCDNAEAAVLMSATPIQLSDNDLYNLLHLLRPDTITTRKDFERMAEPNPFINQAIEFARDAAEGWDAKASLCMESALETPWGRGVLAPNKNIQNTFDSIRKIGNDIDGRLNLIRRLEEAYTFSSYINRTRRRDIGSFTTRKPETISVEFTEEQKGLHDDLIGLISRIMERRHGNISLQFLLTTVRRQAASCIFGLSPLLSAILNRHLSDLELFDSDGEEATEDADSGMAEFNSDIELLIARASHLSNIDPKLDSLISIVLSKQKLPNNKLLLFSGFRHTLTYLENNLSELGIRIGVIHGSIPDDERRILRNRFGLSRDNPEAIDLLLSSEVGCEGLDYQFCDGLINYDLPWNPMRVEQRIGRIDRYGQKSETIAIYNFVTPGTVDAEIYQRCLLRIGVFRQAIGGSEEILGRLTNQIKDIAENLTLTDEERVIRLQQLTDNEVRIIQEQSHLEEEQAKLFGVNVSTPSFDDQVKDASSYWLSPKMLANLITLYIKKSNGGKEVNGLSEKKLISLRLGKEAKEALIFDFKGMNLKGATAKSWESWLKGSDQSLAITFDPVVADERRDITFINPTHPLVRQAAKSISGSRVITTILSVRSDSYDPGRYVFAIYRWRKLGIKEDFTFKSVCQNDDISRDLLHLIESANEIDGFGLSIDEQNKLESSHYLMWSDARANHIEEIMQSATSKLLSLQVSHQAQIELLEEQSNQTTDERIRRMRESQINATERDFKRRSCELEIASSQADIVAEVVAFGVLVIEGIG